MGTIILEFQWNRYRILQVGLLGYLHFEILTKTWSSANLIASSVRHIWYVCQSVVINTHYLLDTFTKHLQFCVNPFSYSVITACEPFAIKLLVTVSLLDAKQ